MRGLAPLSRHGQGNNSVYMFNAIYVTDTWISNYNTIMLTTAMIIVRLLVWWAWLPSACTRWPPSTPCSTGRKSANTSYRLVSFGILLLFLYYSRSCSYHIKYLTTLIILYYAIVMRHHSLHGVRVRGHQKGHRGPPRSVSGPIFRA